MVTCDEAGAKINSSSSYKSRTSNLLKSLNKSISFPSSFPSPKFRAGKDNNYEVKIEPRGQQDGDTSPSETNRVESVPGAAPDTAATAPDCGKSAASPATSPATAASLSSALSEALKSRAATLPPSMSLSSPVEKVDTRVVLDTAASHRTNPKLAFPAAVSAAQAQAGVAAAASASQLPPASARPAADVASSSSNTNTTTKPPSVFKPYEPSWKRQPNPNSYLNRHLNKTSDTNKPSSTATTTTTLQSQYLSNKKSPSTTATALSTAATTVTVSPFSQAAATPPATLTTSSKQSPVSSSASSSPPAPEVKTSPVASSSSSSMPSPVSPSASAEKVSSSKPPAAARPTISKPVLQTATPNAANLIAKAPSTGVSHSSILATKERLEPDPFKPPRERGRRAVFSDTLTLPSPTSPNIPPIIHQPAKETSPEPAPAPAQAKLITPTWSTQATPQPAQAQVCRIDESDTARQRDKTQSPEPGADKSGLSKLISGVKRTPSLSVADKDAGAREKEKQGGKYNSLPRKPERSSVRNLEISAPILQKDIEHKAGLVPVLRSPDSASPEGAVSPPRARHGSPVSTKRPAPPPPGKPALPSKPELGLAGVKEAEEKQKQSKYLPWRSNPTKPSQEAVSPAPDANVHKVSSSDDILSYKKPGEPPKAAHSKFTSKRRPASIATSKPARPQAPPPKPPSSRKNSHDTSPDDIYLYDDASAVRAGRAPLANIQESLSPGQAEPIYDTISEGPELAAADPGTSPEEFVTPVGSPTLPKKKSFDTISTGSSAAEEDLMGQILKEMHSKTEGESIYSSLMRKDKKNRKKKALE